jgi:hypothetical protein
MTAIPVLAAGQTRALDLDGTVYTVRALTYAEHSALQVARAAQPIPSQEVINDALCQAAEAAGRPDLAEAVRAAEDAEDALSAFYAAQPPTLDEEGRARWAAEREADLRQMQRAALRAARQRRLALDLFAGDERLAALRARAAQAMRAAAQELVAAGLVAVDGQDRALTPEDAAALPSPHVAALAEAISALLSPTRDAAKN